MSRIATVRRVVAILLLTLWWGGFSFYAGRVVFIGHQVLKSKIRQGFITERVTAELNWLGVTALALVGVELLASKSSFRRQPIWIAWAVTVIATLVLILLHAKLAGMLDFSARQIADDAHFYDWHRVYLWTATVQWLAGAALLVMFHLCVCQNNPLKNADAG